MIGDSTILFIFIILAICNIASFSLYGVDKRRAINKQWRIKESTLILSAFLFGGIGGLLGMVLFRHKTKHMSFLILVPLAVVINIICVGLYIYYL